MELVIDQRPWSRGVTQLMYVGDDDAVENAIAHSPSALTMCKVGIGLAAIGILIGKKSVRNVGVITALGGFLVRR